MNSTWSYISNRINLFWFSQFIFNLSSGSILYENFMFLYLLALAKTMIGSFSMIQKEKVDL